MSMRRLYPALLCLFGILALPQPLPTPAEMPPTMTTANFAKSTKKVTGTKTTLRVDDTSGEGTVTKIINKTVTTTGKYRGSKQAKPALVTGKLAAVIIGVVIGLIILLVLAIFIYKRRQKKRALASIRAFDTAEEGGKGGMAGEKVDPSEVVSLPIVPGEMGYKEEPANPVTIPTSAPSEVHSGTVHLTEAGVGITPDLSRGETAPGNNSLQPTSISKS